MDGLLESYVDRNELAELFKVHVRTLDRWELERTGPPRTKIGRGVIYRWDAVCDWMRSHEKGLTVPRFAKQR